MEAPIRSRLTHPAAILVATNLSDLHRLMPFALEMADETGAQLRLLHVASAEFAADAAGMPYYDREAAISAAKNMLEPWCERGRKVGLDCSAIIRESQLAAPEIIATVLQIRPDRLILGTRSLGRLGKLLLGSVAEQVLRSVNLPVFTVGPDAHLPQKSSERHPAVLFATALEEDHWARAALACQLAASQGAKLILLHVLPNKSEHHGDSSNVLLSSAADKLCKLAAKIGADACTDVDIKVAHGKPAGQILAEAAAGQVNLIVMGASDHSILDHITHDHTVCQVLARAQCPVLSLNGPIAQQLQKEAEAVASH